MKGYQPHYPCPHQCRPAGNSQAGFQRRPYKDTAFLQEYPYHTLPDPPDPGYAHRPSPLQPTHTHTDEWFLTIPTKSLLRQQINTYITVLQGQITQINQNVVIICVWNDMRVNKSWQNSLIKQWHQTCTLMKIEKHWNVEIQYLDSGFWPVIQYGTNMSLILNGDKETSGENKTKTSLSLSHKLYFWDNLHHKKSTNYIQNKTNQCIETRGYGKGLDIKTL